MKNVDKVVVLPFEPIDKYYEQFRKRVFTLLFIGYSRIRKQRKDLSKSMEDDITARIVHYIEDFRKDKKSPDWVDNIHAQEQHLHAPHNEIGNQRKKLDIFIRGNRKERNIEFCFESKRLNQTTGEEDYFGNKGMQRFLTENYPINTYDEAAMIGYVQDKDVSYWENWLKKRLCLCDRYVIIPELKNTLRTCHKQPSKKYVILFHVLLDFCRYGE